MFDYMYIILQKLSVTMHLFTPEICSVIHILVYMYIYIHICIAFRVYDMYVCSMSVNELF